MSWLAASGGVSCALEGPSGEFMGASFALEQPALQPQSPQAQAPQAQAPQAQAPQAQALQDQALQNPWRTDRPDQPDQPDQLGAAPQLPRCRLAEVAAQVRADGPRRGSQAYRGGSVERFARLSAAVEALSAGSVGMAAELAPLAQYEVCADGDMAVLRPTDRSGQALVALHPAAKADLIVEAPHPYFDLDTLNEALALFIRLKARALVIAGAHRCANRGRACSGRTRVCGEPERFRVSDAAHSEAATFHVAHVALSEAYPAALVVSLHGSRLDGVGLSNGTTQTVAADSPVARFAAGLLRRGLSPVTSCNQGAGVALNPSQCGTTNVQGRHLNASASVCSLSAVGASERFLHVEQSRAVRRAFDPVVEALGEVVEALGEVVPPAEIQPAVLPGADPTGLRAERP